MVTAPPAPTVLTPPVVTAPPPPVAPPVAPPVVVTGTTAPFVPLATSPPVVVVVTAPPVTASGASDFTPATTPPKALVLFTAASEATASPLVAASPACASVVSRDILVLASATGASAVASPPPPNKDLKPDLTVLNKLPIADFLSGIGCAPAEASPLSWFTPYTPACCGWIVGVCIFTSGVTGACCGRTASIRAPVLPLGVMALAAAS